MEGSPAVSGSSGAPALAEIRSSALSNDDPGRRAAADRLRRLMEVDFETVFDSTQEWALDPDERLREVVGLACRHAPDTLDEVRARRLLSRLELFLGDRSDRVASAACLDVMPYLLDLYPAIVPGWVRTWTPNPEESIRADLARLLGAIASRFPTEAIEGLAELAVDPRPRVRDAVLGTLDGLIAHYPKMAPYLRARFADILASA